MTSDSAPLIRREVTFSGRVQGVGFRYTARQIAVSFPVTGFVQNLADGRVLLVAEGTPEVLDRFLGEVREEMARNIRGSEQTDLPASGEFSQFEVRH